MSKTHQELVKDFMIAVDQFDPKAPAIDVANLTAKDVAVSKLRLKLVTEELSELYEAFLGHKTYTNTFSPLFGILEASVDKLTETDFDIDRVAIFDSVVDMEYINLGTAVLFELPIDQGFQHIHENNLTKLDPITGKAIRRADGKILKPTSWKEPDLKQFIDFCS